METPADPLAYPDLIIEHMVAYPGCSNAQIAAALGLATSFVSNLTHTDSFRERLEARKKADAEIVSLSAAQKLAGALDQVVEYVQTAMDQDPPNVTVRDAARLLELLLKAAGRIQPQGVTIQADVINHAQLTQLVSPGFLADARERMRQLALPDTASESDARRMGALPAIVESTDAGAA